MSAADAVLWDLNRLLSVIDRFHSSCKNRPKVETANQYATLRHDSRSLAREASAAPEASFKRDYRNVALNTQDVLVGDTKKRSRAGLK